MIFERQVGRAFHLVNRNRVYNNTFLIFPVLPAYKYHYDYSRCQCNTKDTSIENSKLMASDSFFIINTAPLFGPGAQIFPDARHP